MESMYDVVGFNDGTYGIVENDTNLIITKNLRLWDAEKFIHNQKNGCGFQGRTPPFMALGEYNEE